MFAFSRIIVPFPAVIVVVGAKGAAKAVAAVVVAIVAVVAVDKIVDKEGGFGETNKAFEEENKLDTVFCRFHWGGYR